MKRLLLTVAVVISGAVCLVYAAMKPELTVPPSSITFSHQFHIDEMEAECVACHPDIESSEQASDKNLPTMDECGACHDVEDDESCGTCHSDPEEPEELTNPVRTIAFNHKKHLAMNLTCETCHESVAATESPSIESMPTKPICFTCHDDSKAPRDCSLCHQDGTSLQDIHPIGWRTNHADRAVVNGNYCKKCHTEQSFCLDCHRGENQTGLIHDLNFSLTHGLSAKTDQEDCRRCHDVKSFCVACHEQGLRMPLNHSRLDWRLAHGQAARTDIENCASCHDSADPTCARIGCHADFDGILGTDPPIHDNNAGQFDSEGSWHEEGGVFCYQCHVSSRGTIGGFCNYCHSSQGDED